VRLIRSTQRNNNYGRKTLDVTYENFCEDVDLQLDGYFLFMQQCAPYTKRNKKEFSLVNLSLIYGVIAPKFSVYEGIGTIMLVEYTAIKSGLLYLNSCVTAEMKGVGFRVNSVNPGGIRDGQSVSFLERHDYHYNSRGILDFGDVTDAVNHLRSNSSKYIFGQNIIVDNGLF
jgi:NAD(P)-dependent dehydrogenase (short-subunit alcohol dehydrogenase family)